MNHLPTYSEAPRKAKSSFPSWLNDSDVTAHEKNRARLQSEATRFRIESACLSVLQGSSASLKDCAREHRVSRSTIKTAFRS